MSQKYYIRFRGKVQGPFTVERLHVLATRRRFGRHYEVSIDRDHWSSASEHPELFSSPKKSPASEPRPQETTADHENDKQDDAHPDVATAQDDNVWYYMQDEQQLGPVGFQELRSMAELGTLTAETFVWREGFNEWLEAQRIPDLLPDWATVGQASGGRPVRSGSARHRMNYEKLFLRIVLGGLVATLLIGVGIFLTRQILPVFQQLAATSDQDELAETDVSSDMQPNVAEPAAGDAVLIGQPNDSPPESVANDGAFPTKTMKKPVASSTSGGDEPITQKPQQPNTSTATDKIIGDWADSKGYVTLKLEAGGSGFLFLFSEGGGSGPVNAGGINWNLSKQEIAFSGAVGKGTGVLRENGTEIRATIDGQEFVLARR